MTDLLNDLLDAIDARETGKIRNLLAQGALATDEFHDSIQKAGRAGYDDAVRLILAADPEFHEAKSDAQRAAGQRGHVNTVLMVNSSLALNDRPGNDKRKTLLNAFKSAVNANDTGAAEQTLDSLIKVSFPNCQI